MAITNDDILEFAARLAWNGASDILNRFVLQVTDTNSAPDGDILSDVVNWIEDLYDSIDSAIANNVTFNDLIGRNLTQHTVFGTFGWPTLTAGAQTAEAINPALSVFVYSGTDIPNVQGRKWWGSFTEVENVDGLWGSSIITAVETMMLQFLGSIPAGVSGATIFPVIAHLKEIDEVSGELVDVSPPVVRPYINNTVTNNAGVLTRRRPGSGS